MAKTGPGVGVKRQPQRETGTEAQSRTIPDDEAEAEADAVDSGGEVDPATRVRCPECSGTVVNEADNAERVCSECGLVVKETELDRGPEWRAFDSAERDEKSRVGSPSTPLQHDKGLSTQIGWKNEDANGNTLSKKRRQQMARLRKRDEWFRVRSPRERTLKQALGEIQRMGSALGCNNEVREMSSIIFRRAAEEDLLLGRSIEAVATASLYAACREANIPRTPSEIANVSRVDKLSVERAYRSIVSTLGLAVEATLPRNYTPQFTSALDLDDPERVEKVARELLDAAREENLHSGRSPSGLAGSAIYAAAISLDEDITQPEVAESSDTTCVTIREHYRDLLEAAGRPVPDVT